MKSEHELMQALRNCPRTDNYACRINSINKFGINGLVGSFEVGTAYVPHKPGPSWSTIEKAMNEIFKALTKVVGGPFKMVDKVFKIYYKPHFKMMTMLDQTIGRYWYGLDFMNWSFNVLEELERSIKAYVHLTGHHDFRMSMIYVNRFQGKESDKAVEEIHSVAAALSSFDKMLLNDIEELLKTINKGMDQLLKLEIPKTITDRIALNKVQSEIMMFSIGVQSKLKVTLDSLGDHRKSWALTESNVVIPNFNSELVLLSEKITAVTNSIEGKIK